VENDLAFFRMYEERVAGLALVASHVAEDASRNANADPAQRELAAGRDDLAARLERDGTMDAAVASDLPRYFAPAVYRERPELVERVRAIMQRQNARGCAQLVRGMKAPRLSRPARRRARASAYRRRRGRRPFEAADVS
jgi:hypothetical protein